MTSAPRLALLLAAAAGAALALWATRSRQPPTAIPELRLDPLQPQVAQKIEGLRRRLLTDPESADRWGELAMNLDVHDLRRQSIPFYARAAGLAPNEVRWPYYAAIALEAMGSDDALAWFERARDIAPAYPPVHVRYGWALFDRSRWADAARAFGAAIAADPGVSHAHLGLARIALAGDDLEASREHLLQAIEAAPDHSEAHGLLAEVYRRLGQLEEARRALLQAGRYADETPLPDPLIGVWAEEGVSVYWHLRRGHLALERGDFEHAVREIERAVEAEPRAAELNNLGLALRRLGRRAEAEQRLRQAIALDPVHREALVNLGMTLHELGRSDEAIAAIEQAVAADPNFVQGYLALGTLYSQGERFAAAAAAFRRGLDQAPDDLRMALRLARILATAPSADLRDGAEAVRLARKVCDDTGQQVPEALDVLAAAYAETGAFEAAVATAGRAHQLAIASGKNELARQIRSRLERYRSHRPGD